MIKVTVRGLDGFRHELEVSRDRLVEGTRSLMSDLAKEAASDARARASRGRKTGRAMDSIRTAGPVIRAGDGVPWYGFADFGGRVGIKRSISRPYIKGGRWLFPAIRDVGVYKRCDSLLDDSTKRLR